MQEKKKFILLITGLFVITGVFWSIWIWRAYAWVSYQEVTVALLGTVLIGFVTGMLAVGYALFRTARTSYILINQKTRMVIAIICICIVMLLNFFMLHEFRNFGYTISTLAAVQGKESEGGRYYFQIIDSGDDATVTFECDKETYDALSIDPDVKYSIQYRKLTFGKEKATLGYVNVVNDAIEEGSKE